MTMTMTMARYYTAAEIIKLIEVLRSSGDVPPNELAGLEFLGQLLSQLEHLSDAEIAEEVRRRFRFA
jgi:hypothetical protein